MTIGFETSGTTRSASSGSPGLTKRVAFILSQFPETHETFILREFVGLEAAGLDFVIFSLKPCRDSVVQKDARRLLDRTWYPSEGRQRPGAVFNARVLKTARDVLPWLRSPAKSAYVSWAACEFAGIARSLGVEHLHAHWATAPASAAAVMSEMLSIPWSLTAHAWDIYAGDGRLSAKVRRAMFIATCTAANTSYLRSLLPESQRSKVVLNYHGIPLPKAEKAAVSSNGKFEIIAVGRLVETKGLDYLIEAAARLEFPFHLTIIGDGPLRSRLVGRARALGMDESVSFAGTIHNEDVYRALAKSDAFVMPSVIAGDGDRDGIPNVLLEAMSAGVPVVASSISGIPEAVVHDETGILVPQRDSVAIAVALSQLHRDRSLAGRLAAAARAMVRRRFDAEANARALYDVFRERIGSSAL